MYFPRRRQRFETMSYFSTRGRRTSTRLAAGLGLSQIFIDFSTSTQSSQTRGVYFPRRQKRFETMLYFSTRGRRTSTRLATYEEGPPRAVESTLDFSKIEVLMRSTEDQNAHF